ncbi:MAG TPA: M81 family metallopeptidase [Burkholderiaceae bacterium]|nr:M81 family metallopeptidase [Burkholderiaceae bacterium]
MRVFCATLATETNTFAPMPTGLSAFRERGYFPAGTHPDRPTLFSGPLWAARLRADALGLTVVEGLVAGAMPSGVTTRLAHEALRDELLADLRAAMPVDVVLLGLHGAMVAEGCDDCEGDLLARVRAIVGPDVVVGAELDPHTHLTDAMVRHADLLVAFREYPHTDAVERGIELLEACAATARGEIRPVPAVHDCRTLRTLRTPVEPMRGFVDRFAALEGRDGIVSISAIHGFPWADVADLGTKMLVYADGDAARAASLAARLGTELRAICDATRDRGVPIDAAIDAALADDARPVVMAEGADNAGGGAPSDATFVLRRLVERDVRDATIGPLWDPVAVSIAMQAGEGARLPLRIGGKVAPVSGDPLDAVVEVRALRRDAVQPGLSGSLDPLGDCALVAIGGVEVLLTSRRTQAFDTALFEQFGVALAERRIVVVKSSQHFHASFAKVAARIAYLDSPGALTADLASLPFRKARREIVEGY